MTSKGITPVVATVLLMTIAVAATASAFTFMTNIQDGLKENVKDRQNNRQEISQSDINIETTYNDSAGYMIASIRNTGSITLDITDSNGNRLWNVYIDGQPVGGDGKGWTFRGSSKEVLDPKTNLAINTTKKFPNQGSQKIIRVTGPNEVSDSKVCYNSGSRSC